MKQGTPCGVEREDGCRRKQVRHYNKQYKATPPHNHLRVAVKTGLFVGTANRRRCFFNNNIEGENLALAAAVSCQGGRCRGEGGIGGELGKGEQN